MLYIKQKTQSGNRQTYPYNHSMFLTYLIILIKVPKNAHLFNGSSLYLYLHAFGQLRYLIANSCRHIFGVIFGIDIVHCVEVSQIVKQYYRFHYIVEGVARFVEDARS